MRSKAWRYALQHSHKRIEAMVKPTVDAGPLRRRGQRRKGAGDSRRRRAIIGRPVSNRHWPRARSSPRAQHADSLEEAAASAPRRTKTASMTTQGTTVTSTKSLHEAHELSQQASSPPHTSVDHRSRKSNFSVGIRSIRILPYQSGSICITFWTIHSGRGRARSGSRSSVV